MKGGGNAFGSEEDSCRNDGHCSGTMKERSSLRKAVKEALHRVPEFHEDYYGPRNHKPKHH